MLDIERTPIPTDDDLARLAPIILPRQLLDMAWPGPIVPLGELPFAVAWAVRRDGNIFSYVTHSDALYWDDQRVNWRRVAFDNVAAMVEANPGFGYKNDDEGRPFLQVLLHDDAIGPSRLLLPHLFDDVLGPGYEVAIPEQTCAIAYRKRLTPSQAADVTGMIDGCYTHGTEPMRPDRFDAAQFWNLAEVVGDGHAKET